MTITANIHDVVAVEADYGGSSSWLTIRSKDGCTFNAFIPLHVAQAMAQAFDKCTARDAIRKEAAE